MRQSIIDYIIENQKVLYVTFDDDTMLKVYPIPLLAFRVELHCKYAKKDCSKVADFRLEDDRDLKGLGFLFKDKVAVKKEIGDW